MITVISGTRVVVVIGKMQMRAIISTMVTIGTMGVGHHSIGNHTDQKQG